MLCIWALVWLYKLIEFFDIKDPKFPVALGFIGRKRAVDFNDTTMETFKRVIPAHLYEIRSQEKEIVFENKAKICYGGLDDQETINKFNSAEYCFFAIDQAEETNKADVAVLQASLRFKLNGKTPPYKELYTANPAECWLKDDFVLGTRKNGVFVPALPDDNPYLPVNYKQTLRSAFEYDPALLKAYLEGDWDAFANLDDAMFKAKHFEDCRQVDIPEDRHSAEDQPRIIAVDVATKHGEALTVILYRVGHTIKDFELYKQIPTTRTAQLIKDRYLKYNANVLVIDSDGIGEGVSDILSEQRIGVTEFHGGYGDKAIDQHRYRNLRTQFYDITAKKLERKLYSLKELTEEKYRMLKSQACTIKVKAPDSMGRFQVETKEDMRSREVKSPDIVDALVYSEYGYWISQYADLKPYAFR